MATTVSERVYQMKKNFMRLHNDGYSIPEIAKMYSLSFSCVYKNLQKIAYENSTTREALLRNIRTVNGERNWEREAQKVQIDVVAMQCDFENTTNAIDKILDEITTIMEDVQL